MRHDESESHQEHEVKSAHADITPKGKLVLAEVGVESANDGRAIA